MNLPMLNRCVNLLMAQLADKQEALRQAETPTPAFRYSSHKDLRIIKLRQQIASIETRLRRAEKLQEAAMARRPDRN